MPLKITMADYGVGNLHSIRKALENCGAEVEVVKEMSELIGAECIVLPGVGAFTKSMERLLPQREGILEELRSGTPCLGICIGAQLLFESSEEGEGPGLGLIKGKVVRLRAERIPHMGWNQVVTEDRILEGCEPGYFYFAHSFHGSPEEDAVIGTTDYYGTVPTLFRKVNTYGTQFHPEKSSGSGMRMLRNFVRFAEEQL